jgi:hypothetical protein
MALPMMPMMPPPMMPPPMMPPPMMPPPMMPPPMMPPPMMHHPMPLHKLPKKPLTKKQLSERSHRRETVLMASAFLIIAIVMTVIIFIATKKNPKETTIKAVIMGQKLNTVATNKIEGLWAVGYLLTENYFEIEEGDSIFISGLTRADTVFTPDTKKSIGNFGLKYLNGKFKYISDGMNFTELKGVSSDLIYGSYYKIGKDSQTLLPSFDAGSKSTFVPTGKLPGVDDMKDYGVLMLYGGAGSNASGNDFHSIDTKNSINFPDSYGYAVPANDGAVLSLGKSSDIAEIAAVGVSGMAIFVIIVVTFVILRKL